MKLRMSALIVCGGKGSRLGKLGKKMPKSLVNIGTDPILIDIIKIIPLKICSRILISGYYMFNKIESHIRKNKFTNILLYNDGDIEILQRIKLHLIRERKPIVVFYGDELANINFNKLIKSHLKSKKLLTITTYEHYSNFGFLKKKNNKYYFEEKPFIGNYNIGFMIFNFENIKYINKAKKIENYINKLCKMNQVNEYRHKGYHITFNSLEELEKARENIKEINAN